MEFEQRYILKFIECLLIQWVTINLQIMDTETVFGKKKSRKSDVNSPRCGPEGDSINNKEILKMKKTKSPKPAKVASSDSENISPSRVLSKKKKRKSSDNESRSMDYSSGKKSKNENVYENHDVVTNNRKVISPKRKKEPSTTSLNASWEKAVEKARGLPDGATEGTEESFFTHSDPNSPEKKKKDKSMDEKKGKKKTMNVRIDKFILILLPFRL